MQGTRKKNIILFAKQILMYLTVKVCDRQPARHWLATLLAKCGIRNLKKKIKYDKRKELLQTNK